MRRATSPILIAPVSVLVLSAVAGEPAGPRTHLAGPFMPELEERYRGLGYEEFLGRLPERPEGVGTPDFDPATARYFDVVRHELELTDEEVEVYRRNGFVSVDNGRGYSFTTAYHDIYTSDLPVLITTDSILYALHKSFEQILKELELGWFRITLDEVLSDVHEALGNRTNVGRQLTANYRDVDLYVTVARRLLNGTGASSQSRPEGEPGGGTRVASKFGQDDQVDQLLAQIASLKLQHPLNDPATELYGGSRAIDFSQFRARGHYADSYVLECYFRTMAWLGRADTGWNVLPTDPRSQVVSDDRRELRDAVLFVELLRETGGDERLGAIERVLHYLVGSSDFLGVQGLGHLMDETGVASAADLLPPAALAGLQEAISATSAAGQHIRSQAIVSDPTNATEAPPPATFQVFGQRFVIDSYLLSRLVFDSIIFEGRKQQRLMPTGLDVMAALGNDSAIPLLEGELRRWNYSANLLAAREFADQQPEAFWGENLYGLWLGALRRLDDGLGDLQHAPQVMQTETWQRKQLQTQLASWSQLRRDTVLYAKQSSSAVPGCEYPSGYVEPYPAFYATVGAFAERARELLRDAPFDSDDKELAKYLAGMKERQIGFFSNMATRMGQLEALAKKELCAEAFSGEEQEFIARTICKLGSAKLGSGSGPAFFGWYTELFYKDQPYPGVGSDLRVTTTGDGDIRLPSDLGEGPVRFGRSDMVYKPTCADVHTNPEDGAVLQVATGNVNLCIIAVDSEDERTAYVGPVFSYHEFTRPAGGRLGDHGWAEELDGGSRPARPTWTRDFATAPRTHATQPRDVAQRLGDRVTLTTVAAGQPATAERAQWDTVALTDEGLQAIAEFTGLRSLDLSESPLTDTGLASLAPLTNLRNLSLSGTGIDGSGLGSLSGARWLRRLLLSDTGLTDSSLAHLRGLPHLEILDLSGSKITPQSLELLGTMEGLRDLDLSDTALDQADLEALRLALPNCRVRG